MLTCLFSIDFEENCKDDGNSSGGVTLFVIDVLLVLCGDGVNVCRWWDGKLRSTVPNELATGGRTNAKGFNSNGCRTKNIKKKFRTVRRDFIRY